MAMKFIDMTGKTEDEAIAKALAQLGLDRDDVSVEILERAKSGFFGIGASPAKVRVSYGLEEEAAPVAAPAAPAKAEKAEKRAEESAKPAPRQEKRKTEKKPAEKREEPRAKKEEAAAPVVVDLGEPCTDDKAKEITAFLTGLPVDVFLI